MLDVFSKFALNLDAEVNGVWKNFHGAEVLVARSGTQEYLDAMAEAYAKHEEKLSKDDDAADKLAKDIMLEIFANHLILDWKGFAFKGKELPYSKANVKMLLGLPEMRDFRQELLALCDDVENFRLEKEAAQTKN